MAGSLLNELEFPPRGGTSVVFDGGAPITITFSTPVHGFGAYLTYLVSVTLTAFDALNNPVGQATSLFTTNLLLSGDPGSTPNEYFQVAFAPGIASVTITGDPTGSSFTLDDATITTSGVPEPSSVLFLATGLAVLMGSRVGRRYACGYWRSCSGTHTTVERFDHSGLGGSWSQPLRSGPRPLQPPTADFARNDVLTLARKNPDLCQPHILKVGFEYEKVLVPADNDTNLTLNVVRET